MGMSLEHCCVYCLLRFLPMLACELAAIRSTDRKHSCDGLKTGLVGGDTGRAAPFPVNLSDRM